MQLWFQLSISVPQLLYGVSLSLFHLQPILCSIPFLFQSLSQYNIEYMNTILSYNNNNNAKCALIVSQARKVQQKHLVTFGNIWKNHTIPCTQQCKHVITKVFVLLSACKNLAMFTRHFSFTPTQKHLVCNFFWCLNKLKWPMFWKFYYCKQIMFYGWKILCFNCIQIHIAITVSRYCTHFCYTQMFILVTNMKLTWLPPNLWKHKTFPAEHSPLTIIHNKF